MIFFTLYHGISFERICFKNKSNKQIQVNYAQYVHMIFAAMDRRALQLELLCSRGCVAPEVGKFPWVSLTGGFFHGPFFQVLVKGGIGR